MAGEKAGVLLITLSGAQQDVLELVRDGALPSWPPGSRSGTLTIPVTGTGPEDDRATDVELVDLEGVPVARLPLAHDDGGVTAHGIPTWLSARSARPFEQWHVPPRAVAGHSGLVVLTPGADESSARAALQGAGPCPLLLVLASLDRDGAADDAVSVVRLAQALADEVTGARLAIAPAPTLLGAEAQQTVIDSYAHGQSVTRVEAVHTGGAQRAGLVLFLTGLSGSGKSTLARAVRNRLLEDGRRVTLLDGDVVRSHLSAGLGFSVADRDTNIRRIGWVAAEIAHHGGTVICCPIAPFERTRTEVGDMVRSRGGRFVLVHVATPLEECERRDRKGLYARARRGEIADFTGISSPYEQPDHPDLRIDTTGRDLEDMVDQVLALAEDGAGC